MFFEISGSAERGILVEPGDGFPMDNGEKAKKTHQV